MGFRSVEMKRSEFFASQSANEAATQSELPRPAEGQGSPGDEQASAAASEDGVPADSILAAPLGEPPNGEVVAGADAVPEDVSAFPEGDDALAADIEAVPETAAAPEDVEAVLQGVDVVADGADLLPEAADALPEVAGAVAEGGDAVPVDMTASPAPNSSDEPHEESASGQPVSPQASDSRAELAKNAEMVTVWRPDHRKTAPRREREARHSRSEAPGRSDAQGQTPVVTPWRREAAHPPTRPNRPNSARAEEKRRQRPKDYDMARSTPTPAPQKPAKVDPNSPFAKLLELRSLLEEKANKRQ
jgi:ATP-dependent RNA helicase SUPV3L1/SUV3